jgi:hypothetical protein
MTGILSFQLWARRLTQSRRHALSERIRFDASRTYLLAYIYNQTQTPCTERDINSYTTKRLLIVSMNRLGEKGGV